MSDRAEDAGACLLYTSIGLVPQEPFLFSGSVADNVRYGRPEAGDDDVLHAARAISGGEWVAALPAGLQTDVGERGGNLSMGLSLIHI